MHHASDNWERRNDCQIDPDTERLIRRAHDVINRRNAERAAQSESTPQSDDTISTEQFSDKSESDCFATQPDPYDGESMNAAESDEQSISANSDSVKVEMESESIRTTPTELIPDSECDDAMNDAIEDDVGYTARPIGLLEREKLEWLWPGRVPIGKVTILAGLPGIGKSLVATDWAARVSTGSGWPGSSDPREPASVLIINAEDSPHDTILPRLAAAGADVDRVLTINSEQWDSIDITQRKQGRLGECIELLENSLRERPAIRLVVLDPISAFCSDIDTLSQTDVRVLLGMLGRIAARHKVAVVAVAQLTKSPTRESVDRAIGALTFAASARAVWILAPHPEDPRRRLMLPGKSNLAPTTDELTFKIRDDRVQWSKHRSRIQWPEMVQSVAQRRELSTPAVREAADWLGNQLAHGPLAARELRKDAVDCGFSWRVLCSAKNVLQVVATREGYGAKGAWHWELPKATRKRTNSTTVESPDLEA